MPNDQSPPVTRGSWKITAPEMPSALSLIIVLAFIAIVFMMIFFPPKSADQAALAIINMLLGALVAKFGTVVDWWFGSNKQQQQQQDVISAIAQQPTPLAVAQVAPTTSQLGESMLSNGQLTYFKTLTDEDAKKAFLAMSAAEREATVAKVGT